MESEKKGKTQSSQVACFPSSSAIALDTNKHTHTHKPNQYELRSQAEELRRILLSFRLSFSFPKSLVYFKYSREISVKKKAEKYI